MTDAADIAAALRRYRFTYSSEDDLQAGVAVLLDELGFHGQREARLGSGSRIDLLIGRVGVEVKIKGTPGEVGRQLRRYLARPELDELVLVTAVARHQPADLGVDDPRLTVVNVAHAA